MLCQQLSINKNPRFYRIKKAFDLCNRKYEFPNAFNSAKHILFGNFECNTNFDQVCDQI